ncbi:MAG: TIM barrel protein [Chthoniobacteraceae bacterium]|nr:TIM barrel protein [Chthoniobacteraceae bacterium]
MIPYPDPATILLHTIALEPARWTSQRVSQSLLALLPRIAAAGFHAIEVFEPHLQAQEQWPQIQSVLREQGITPVVLSSYIDLNPARTPDQEIEQSTQRIKACCAFFGFKKLRVFPGSGMQPGDAESVRIYTERLARLVRALPEVDILLETHDHSLADDPAAVLRIVQAVAAPNLGLLYQPTLFKPQEAWDQFQLQKGHIRHLHLQNRNEELGFVSLASGVVQWEKILGAADASVGATLEFVPSGICPVEQFDLETVLAQAKAEVEWIAGLGKK